MGVAAGVGVSPSDPKLHVGIAKLVSAFLGYDWQVAAVVDRCDDASHPAAILRGQGYSVFVKLGSGLKARDEFEKEIAGLSLLRERGGALTPRALGTVELGDATAVVLEAIDTIEVTPMYWREVGRHLARLHRVKSETFGLQSHCYWGGLYQDNSPGTRWLSFFRERRIMPRLRGALDSGNLPTEFAARVENACKRMDELGGAEVLPSLLHGDAHRNNFLCSPAGPVMIDPSAYFGHPEIDLAHLDFFAPVPDAVFEGYQELAPLERGFAERRELWRLPTHLAVIEVDGPKHLHKLQLALGQYA